MLTRYPIKSQAARDAAEGEACTLEIVGVCQHDDTTTVLAHLPDESHGLSRKSDDLSAAFACFHCHDVLDGRQPWPESEAPHREAYMRRGQTRTWRRLLELGVFTVKGVNA